MIEVRHRRFEETLARAAEIGGADLIFTSPPYPTVDPGGKGREGAPPRQYGGDTPRDFRWEDYQRLGNLCFSALKPGGFCIVVVDGPIRFWRSKKIGSERSLIAFRLAIDWSDRVGFRYVEHGAYLRDGATGDFFPRFRSGWEPLHVFQRPGARGHFDAWAYTMPAKHPGKSKPNTAQRMWNGMVGTGRRGIRFVQSSRRTLTTAVTATDAGGALPPGAYDREHPAAFTRRVAEVHVLCYSPPGGLVVDPFNGSGTTGFMAARHGRSFIGGDLGARERDGRRWADIGQERAEEAAAELARQVTGTAPAADTAPPRGAKQMDLI